MPHYLSRLSLVVLLGLTVGSAAIAPPIAQAEESKLTYKEQFDRRIKFADEGCVPKKKQFRGLEYQICHMEDVVMKVSMEGPPGDNGPTAYFYSGRLYAFRDTGHGQASLFKDGKLLAEVEVGSVAPEYNKIKTQFSPRDRKETTDRAISSTRNMLKVFGKELRL
jgi:hypothetical protein